MALASAGQEDFGGGIYRGRKAPPESVYDAVNCLINDEGLPFRRGGSAYKTTSDVASALKFLWDGQLAAGRRTVFVSDRLYTLDTNDATPVQIGSPMVAGAGTPTEVSGYLIFPELTGAGVSVFAYAGSRKTDSYGAGTVTVTNGSTAVTGTGTLWAANVDAGMMLNAGVVQQWGIVESVDSNTQLTLRDPWPYPTSTGVYTLWHAVGPQLFTTPLSGAVAGSAAQRLLLGQGSKVYFSPRGTPLDMATRHTTDYHVIPDGSTITGIRGLGDSAVVFSSAGVWEIGNMSLDDVDAFGNVQQFVQRVSGDVILWGDAGLASWASSLLVPAVDDVYVFRTDDAPVVASANIRPLYRSYVKAGYQPGTAAVHRGHYFLPVLNGSTLVDVLVCRLDRGFAWTRWAGHAAGAAYAVRIGATTRTPKLLGISGKRVTDLTNCLDPAASNAADADGSTSDCVITTRDYPTGGNQHGFVKRARLRYELADDGSGGTPAPTVAVGFSSDQDAGVFTTLTEKGLQGGGTGGAVSDGSGYSWWLVGKKRERIRFRITVAGACASFVLRSIELLLRPSGKQ